MGKYAVQKYRYGDMVVEVAKIVDVTENIRKFQCLVRGFGHGNQTPRKQYIIETETNAKASRLALQMYKQEYGTK